MSGLAQQLIAHPKWKWHIGMVAERSARVYDVGKCFAGYEVPDIHHPATKGWLLAMLREAGGEYSRIEASASPRVYRGFGFGGASLMDWHPTEGAALASALLAAWGEP